MFLVVRLGPAPADTEDARGDIHAEFSGCQLVRLSAAEWAAVGAGRPAAAGPPAAAFAELVRGLWAAAVQGGHGHMLVGACATFAVQDRAAGASCGFTVTDASGVVYAPQGYVRLYAVAACPSGAVALDYRGRAGEPGGGEVAPEPFFAGEGR